MPRVFWGEAPRVRVRALCQTAGRATSINKIVSLSFAPSPRRYISCATGRGFDNATPEDTGSLWDGVHTQAPPPPPGTRVAGGPAGGGGAVRCVATTTLREINTKLAPESDARLARAVAGGRIDALV